MSADEFDVIANHFAPLAGEGARSLIDDVAVLQTRGDLVLTTDTIVEGVHFLPDDPIDTVAQKALRVNVSDLAAKGARPVGVLLALTWPDARSASEIALFADGLKRDLAFYETRLFGGDTTRTPGPLTITVTALGEPLGARTPSRADARVGDDVWLTGEIGASWVGLQLRLGAISGLADAESLVRRYRAPEPPTAFARVIAQHANASMDVSDGLAVDAAKLSRASQVSLAIEAGRVPLPDSVRDWADGDPDRLRDLLSGGDDYEILFTAAASDSAAIERAARETGIAVSRIGKVTAGQGLTVIDADGRPMVFARAGHSHKLGR